MGTDLNFPLVSWVEYEIYHWKGGRVEKIGGWSIALRLHEVSKRSWVVLIVKALVRQAIGKG